MTDDSVCHFIIDVALALGIKQSLFASHVAKDREKGVHGEQTRWRDWFVSRGQRAMICCAQGGGTGKREVRPGQNGTKV